MTSIARAALLALGCVGSVVEPAFAVTLNLAHTPETIYVYPTAFGAVDPIAMVDCFEGLVAMDASGDAIPGQASSWTISSDGLTYTFALREGIAWSNGDPVVAADFLAAFQWLLNPANAFEFAYLQFPIKNAAAIAAGSLSMDELGVKPLDNQTLEISLEHPAPYFLQTLTHSTAYPIPSALQAERGRSGLSPEDLVCNGPYVITGRNGDLTTAVKSERYYDRASLAADDVNYYAVEDVPAALERFKAGEIDMFYDLPASANAWIESNAIEQSNVVPFLGLAYLAFNLDKPPFDQASLRRALSMAIDRSAIDPQGVRSDRTAAYGLVPEGTANYDGIAQYRPEWADWPYEQRLAEAATTLADLGYTPENPLVLEIRYSSNSSDLHQQVARQVASMWSEIGVQTELFSATSKDHLTALNAGDFDIGRLTWILDLSDPANILELMGSSSEFNVGHYNVLEIDEQLAEANAQLDLAARAKTLAEVERRVMEDDAVIPLSWIVVRNLIAADLSGIEDNAKNTHPTRWVSKR
ncbi:peptide ABC transporter substrate-binding protein [Devosia riboflavina]